MKRKFKFGALFIVLILGTMMFAGCSEIKMDRVYTHYLYNGFNAEFIKTGNSVEFFDDYAFRETLSRGSKSEIETPYLLKGNYIYDTASKTIQGEFFSQSFESFVVGYKKELIAQGVNSYIADLIASTLNKQTTFFVDSEILFKLSAIQAARTGDVDDNLNTLEGIYNIDGFTSSGQDTILLKRGVVYSASKKLDDNDNLVYDEKVGSYSVSGRFLTLTPDKKADSKAPNSQKYLISSIKFGVVSEDMIDKTGMSEEQFLAANKLVQAISNKRIKVLILDFYSTQKF